jgi:hypothetical protein
VGYPPQPGLYHQNAAAQYGPLGGPGLAGVEPHRPVGPVVAGAVATTAPGLPVKDDAVQAASPVQLVGFGVCKKRWRNDRKRPVFSLEASFRHRF